MSETKTWGSVPFWGLGYEWDPQWLLTPAQKDLQGKLIELCRTTLRENAVESDRELKFPRPNFEAMASLGATGSAGAQTVGRSRREPHLRRHGD